MGFVIELYVWGVIVELLFHSYALIKYSFLSKERSTYQANLNKVGLSWDPLNLEVYPLSEFKHTALRFWGIQFLALLESLLSWYQVLYRVHRIMKGREIRSMLTPEQKQASFVLQNDPTLTEEEVMANLKILDPSLIAMCEADVGDRRSLARKKAAEEIYAILEKKAQEENIPIDVLIDDFESILSPEKQEKK